MTKTSAVILLSGLVFSTAVLAEDVIEQRQDLMKQAGKSAKVIGGMLKKQEPFDATAAMAALEAWKNTADNAGDLFPLGSDTGHDTEASPEIWNNREGFESKMADFKYAADKAIEANPASLAALGEAVNPVFKTCKGCHEDFRIEKDD